MRNMIATIVLYQVLRCQYCEKTAIVVFYSFILRFVKYHIYIQILWENTSIVKLCLCHPEFIEP